MHPGLGKLAQAYSACILIGYIPRGAAALRNTSSHGRRSGGVEELFALGRMENGNEITRRSGEAARRPGHCRCINWLHRAPPAYAENATAALVSADGNHVVDVDLNGDASDVGSDDQSESVSDAETDKTWKAFETLMTANNIIIEAAFYFFCLPLLFTAALILVLYKLFWPQR